MKRSPKSEPCGNPWWTKESLFMRRNAIFSVATLAALLTMAARAASLDATPGQPSYAPSEGDRRARCGGWRGHCFPLS